MDAVSKSFLSIIQPSKLFTTSSSPFTISCAITQPKPPPATTNNNNKKPSTPTTAIFNALDNLIDRLIEPSPLRPSVDPSHVFSNNYAPVDELPPTECQVIQGTLPPCLHGAYIRNGPNAQYPPVHGPFHLFDGDGMLHSLRISRHRPPIYCSRFVRTYKYSIERDAGSPLVPNFFSGFNGLLVTAARGTLSAFRLLAGQFSLSNGIGAANTSLALFGNRLYALCEGDLPYAVRLTPDADIQTLGRCDFEGKLSENMTAHPKTDPDTGETFAYKYGAVSPFLTFFRFDKNGNKIGDDVPIFSMPRPTFVHDFAVTKKYAVFPDTQLEVTAMEMVMRGGSLVQADTAKVPRLGVIPRCAKDETEMRWIDVPGFNILHVMNAWDEDDGDAIVIVAPNILSIEQFFEKIELIHGMVEKVRIDLKAGTVTRSPMSTRNLDFGVINKAYLGKKNRYVYAAVGDPMPRLVGVVKLDLWRGEGEECTVASRMYGEGCYGSEPCFVAREPDNPNAKEDDGYVVSYVHDEQAGESRFMVMDANSPNLDIVAIVKLPQRVPSGFHGLFVRESDLTNLF